MQFVGAAFMVIVADAVFPRPAPVLYLVDQVVLREHLQRPENRGFVHGVQRSLQIREAECVVKLLHGLVYQCPYCSLPYIVMCKYVLNVRHLKFEIIAFLRQHFSSPGEAVRGILPAA